MNEGNAAELDDFRHCVDEIYSKVDKLEQRVDEVQQFHFSTCKKQYSDSRSCSVTKEKDKDKDSHIPSLKKQRQEAVQREAIAAKRMKELMRHFGTILRQISQHKWAWPFMQPVDVHGLGLHDYFEVIDRPMDFSTIKNQMEVKDDIGYRNVRDIYADVRLVFDNAMQYNDEQSDVHMMAKTLSEKFEEKWLQLLPKVIEEEKRREEEEMGAQSDLQLAQEMAHAKSARELSNELHKVDAHLEEIKDLLVQKCRKFSSNLKRKLGTALTRLSPDNLTKALEIVAQSNSSLYPSVEEVDIDMGAQSESTLWRLKFFVKDALESEDDKNANMGSFKDIDKTTAASGNLKRKKGICDVVTKSDKNRNK